MVVRVDRPFNMLMGFGSLTFVTGQSRNCCAKFCSCRTLCSILAATMRQTPGYRKLCTAVARSMWNKLAYFLLTVPRTSTSFVDIFNFVFIFTKFSYLCHAALWPPAGKGLISWLSCMWCFLIYLSLSHTVSCVRCGTWSYRFLIIVFFPTFTVHVHLFLIPRNFHNRNRIKTDFTKMC